MTDPTNTPDDTETMTLEELGEAMLDASDQWDGDEAMQHHVLAFLRHYADLDRRIHDARESTGADEPILFAWNDEQGTLTRVAPPTEEQVWDEVERARGKGYGEEHDTKHGLIHVLQHALLYGYRGMYVESLGLVQAALNIIPTSKRVDVWPISIFIGEEQAAENRVHRAELAEQGKVLPPADEADFEVSPEFLDRLRDLMADSEIPVEVARENAGYPAKAASAHHGIADASTIAERYAAEQARDAEAE